MRQISIICCIYQNARLSVINIIVLNYILYHNKNNDYDWKKLAIINPILYRSLVSCITTKEVCNKIIDIFKTNNTNINNILCKSIPI